MTGEGGLRPTGTLQGASDYRKLAPAAGGSSRERTESLGPRALGQNLFYALFRDEVRSYLRRSQDELTQQSVDGLRIRLLLTDVPELAGLPWELLYDPADDQFLNLSSQTRVVRCLDVLQREEPLAMEAPLRVLVMISAPKDQPTPGC